MYDYLIVGAGLYGSVCAHEQRRRGKSVLVVDRRPHTGGNVHCETRDGIAIHSYGPHVFHTSDERIWRYVSGFVTLNRYVNSPLASYKGELYNLPFNMNTYYELWGVRTPAEARAKLEEQRPRDRSVPVNLEEQALALVGRDLYEKLVRGYTEKQWGRLCTELPPGIIKRLPLRFTFDNNYYDADHQGVPEEGYDALIGKLLDGCDVRLGVDYLAHRRELSDQAERIIYTGALDAFYDYRFGQLAYRSLRFETERLDEPNHQGVAVVNYTDRETPYTRSIEHKHFAALTMAEVRRIPVTYVTREYPQPWAPGAEAYYPVGDPESLRLHARYAELARLERRVSFGGRLADYRYYDMDQVIGKALSAVGA